MFERVGVVGVGFMGGSFALACKEAINCQLFGVDINPEAIKKAKELGVIDDGAKDIRALGEFKPELLVLATPVRTFLSIAQSLVEVIGQDCIVSDLGSVKGSLVYRMEGLLNGRFVGGHPIAGTEKAGVENALRDLFRGKRFILTPTDRTWQEAKEKIRGLWERFGSLVEEMDPYLHDFVFGAVSHLPHAVAFALIHAIEGLSGEVNLFRYPGGGFKDFTRIAASDPIMWRDIFLENAQEVLRSMDAFVTSLKRLRELIEGGEEEELTRYLSLASNLRRSLG
ncbi:MAG: prephenate dehydrogenase/arogenate dehydrogenase family protein [Aquificaceae bacterium]|nr:prephenate dehydrogenase/arogenate dehydrogenase family protein [Aquificaceae bacterium]MDW8032222.1 prephenate dehydrogenase/arogenate dehydrogenase family protein [Aquificaceae bacterium]MDW8293884.1 prephenate dehydrogenase/arogenate dehydrogenase family protein [Aquificaceae bacterium]